MVYSIGTCPGCRETFTLYYYHAYSDEATSTFPPWREGGLYKKIDTLAAHKLLEQNGGDDDVTERKTYSIDLEGRSVHHSLPGTPKLISGAALGRESSTISNSRHAGVCAWFIGAKRGKGDKEGRSDIYFNPKRDLRVTSTGALRPRPRRRVIKSPLCF